MSCEHARRRLLRDRARIRSRSAGARSRIDEQVPHQLFSRLTIVPTPWSVSSSISSECVHPAVDDVGEADALLDRVGAGPELGDHALADAVVIDPLAQLGGGQARHQRALVLRIFEQARRGGQIDDLLGLHRDRDRPRRLVGVDVVGLAFGIRADGRDHRRQPVVEQAVDELGADRGDVADEAERRIGRRHRQQPRILARHADRDRLVAGLAVDRRDEVAVDLADQHHADDLERLGVGDAKPVLELRLLADAAQHRVDLRPAAVDQHAAHADAAQQQHVLRQREVDCRGRSPRRRASPRPTCRRTGGCRAAPRRGRARSRARTSS